MQFLRTPEHYIPKFSFRNGETEGFSSSSCLSLTHPPDSMWTREKVPIVAEIHHHRLIWSFLWDREPNLNKQSSPGHHKAYIGRLHPACALWVIFNCRNPLLWGLDQYIFPSRHLDPEYSRFGCAVFKNVYLNNNIRIFDFKWRFPGSIRWVFHSCMPLKHMRPGAQKNPSWSA